MEFLVKEHRSKQDEARILMRPDWTTMNAESLFREAEEISRALCEYVDNISRQKPSFAGLIVGYEAQCARMETLEGCIANLHESMQTSEIEKLSVSVDSLFRGVREHVWTHMGFYRAHRSFRMMKAYKKLNEEEQTAFATQLSFFKATGIFLPKRLKSRIARYERELATLQTQFNVNCERSQSYPAFVVRDPAHLAGINKNVVASMRAEAVARNIDGWVAFSSWNYRGSILEGAQYRPLREAVFRANDVAASDIGAGGASYNNRPIAERILLLRERIAKAYGSKNFAQYTIASHVSATPKAVRRFLTGMIKPVVRNAKADFVRLQKFAKAELGHDVAPWDVEYVRRLYIKKEYGYTGNDMQDFLTLHSALTVLFRLIKEQYGCRIVEHPDPKGWHSCVRFFEVYEHGGKLLGGFYLDPYARSGEVKKSDSACWVRPLVYRRRLSSGEVVVPVAVLHLGFLGIEDPQVTRLSLTELSTLFHEFGHLCEYLFDHANFLTTSIQQRECDVMEVVSMFMENWAWDIEVLAEIIRMHNKRGKIPLQMLLAIHRQRPIVESIGRWSLLDYLEQALIDLELHERPARKGVVDRVMKDVFAKMPLLAKRYTGETRYPNQDELYFTEGYASTVYTYLWSWKFAAAIRAVHLRGARSLDPIVSRRFRREYIEAANVRTTDASLRAFFGTNLPSAKALLERTRMV